MASIEFSPGEPVLFGGQYVEVNGIGSRTGRMIFVSEGDEFPDAPRGHRWRPLRELSVAELRARARQYLQMATTARTLQAASGLRGLADKFDELADRREQEDQDRS